jgi:hypothetical protein
MLINKIHITSGDYSYVVEDLIISWLIAFGRLGYKATFELNKLDPSAININIGATEISLDEFNSVKDRLIHYNVEQIIPENWLGTAVDHIRRLQIGYVWDYCKQNIEKLKKYNIHNAYHVPVGYVGNTSNIPFCADPDIDVLFYGFETPRRVEVLNKLRVKRLNVVTSNILFPWDEPWSAETRDSLISRSKVILNTHAYTTNNIFEIIRVSHILSNKKVVVSEIHEDTYIEEPLLKGIVHGSIEQLPDLCEFVVKNDDFRSKQEQIGFNVFKSIDQTQYLLNGLTAYSQNVDKLIWAKQVG